MMTTGGKETKGDQKTIITRLLNDEQLLVHINPHYPGVNLPAHLLENKTVTLRLSRYFRGSLLLEETQISAELLFGAEYFTCLVPWKSIWGTSSVRGEEYVWAESAPEHILELVLAEQAQAGATSKRPSAQPKAARAERANASHLRRVK